MTPREFASEYVYPAVELWKQPGNQSKSHLAVHALAQIDILAELAAIHTAGRPLQRGEAKTYREGLYEREPDLRIVRDIHASHKHGQLKRTDALATQGQRPAMATYFGWIVGRTFVGGPPSRYQALSFQSDSGSPIKVYSLIQNALDAWDRELKRVEPENSSGSKPL